MKYGQVMKQILTIFIILLGFTQLSNAQQDTHYTGYMFNSLVINPAYSGSRGHLSALAYYRHQWANIPTAPRDISISVHSPFKEKVGLGIYVENDQIGVHNRLSAFASYSYRFSFLNGELSAGLQGGILNYTSNLNEVENLPDIGDAVFASSENRLLPNFGVGLLYFTQKSYIGFSIPHLLNNENEFIEKETFQRRHYFLGAGTVLPLNSTNLKLRPTILIKSIPAEAPISIDLSLSFILKNTFLVGLAHRFGDSFSIFTEIYFTENLRAGYAYDYPIKKVATAVGSHEFFVGYDFIPKDVEKIISPRFF